MKYLKRYEKFLNENVNNINKNIDSQLMIVENNVLGDFSSSFWDMSMRSSVFTEEEKTFIKENLTTYDVDLVNEGWLGDMMTKVYDTAKDKGKKVFTMIKSKIVSIKNGIKDLVAGITDFIKNFISSLSKATMNKIKPLYEKAKGEFEEKTKGILEKAKPNPEALAKEKSEFTQTYEFLKNKMTSAFSAKIEVADDKVLTDVEAEVGSLESSLQLESFDILKSFYITEADEYQVGDKVKYTSKAGDEVEKEILAVDGDTLSFKNKAGDDFTKQAGDVTKVEVEGEESQTQSEGEVEDKHKSLLGKGKEWFMKWFFDMEKASKPQEGGKAKWWLKLILKVFSLVLSPIVKLLEVGAKAIVSKVCEGTSMIVNKLGGPGVFKFLIIGGIVAGIPALITEITLVSHSMPEPWAHIFEVVSHFLTEISGISILLTIFGGFCTFMTLHQLIVEFKHLFGGHDDGHGEESTGEEPTQPTPQPA